MFQLHGFASRPVRYAIVAAHTFREALEDLSVDAKIRHLANKVADLEAKLEALDDSIDETPVEPEVSTPVDEPKTKAKRGTTTRKPRAKAKK